jgi:pullulanase
LPIASQNQSNWPIMQPLLANLALKPGPSNIARARDGFRELLKIRSSSKLFRMQTLAEVQANLHFLNSGPGEIPGLIVMKLDNNGGEYGPYDHIVVVFNAGSNDVQFQNDTLKGLHLRLHPVQEKSTDPVVRKSSFDSKAGSVSVPALTTAVFVSGRD